MWRGEFFKIGKRDLTFIREMRVMCHIFNLAKPQNKTHKQTNMGFDFMNKILKLVPYVCCRRDDFEALIFRCEAIETTSFNGGKTADVKVSHFQF